MEPDTDAALVSRARAAPFCWCRWFAKVVRSAPRPLQGGRSMMAHARPLRWSAFRSHAHSAWSTATPSARVIWARTSGGIEESGWRRDRGVHEADGRSAGAGDRPHGQTATSRAPAPSYGSAAPTSWGTRPGFSRTARRSPSRGQAEGAAAGQCLSIVFLTCFAHDSAVLRLPCAESFLLTL